MTKTIQYIMVAVGIATLATGCMSRDGGEYEGGAIGGAAVGGVAGAVIGNQVDHPATGAVIGAAAGATAGQIYEAKLSKARKREYQIQADNLHFWNQRSLRVRNGGSRD